MLLLVACVCGEVHVFWQVDYNPGDYAEHNTPVARSNTLSSHYFAKQFQTCDDVVKKINEVYDVDSITKCLTRQTAFRATTDGYRMQYFQVQTNQIIYTP